MNTLTIVVVIVIAALLALALAVRIVWQYEQGVLFRLGRLRGSRAPGLAVVFSAPLMSTIEELAALLARENTAAGSGVGRGVSQPDGATAPAIPG